MIRTRRWPSSGPNSSYTSEEGESKAHTFHWIRNLAALGQVDTGVTANHPLAKVFTKNGAKTYVASNITNTALTVTYSDGKVLSVPAGKTVANGANNWTGGNANGGGTVTTPPPLLVQPAAQPAGLHRNPGLAGQAGHVVEHRERLPGGQRGRRQHRHPVVQRVRRPAVDPGRPRLVPGAQPDRAELGGRVRQGVPDRDVGQRQHAGPPLVSVSGRTGGNETHTVTGTGRYVRLTGTERGTPYGYSLWEFKVFGCTPTTPPTTTPPTTTPPTTTPPPTTTAPPGITPWAAGVAYRSARWSTTPR